MSELLELAKSRPRKKTHLMYKANLSYKQLQAYLEFLVDRGLLMRSENGSENPKLFETTAKGRAFLRVYRGLKGLLAA